MHRIEKVLVVGGGVIGLSLAIGLARQRLAVELVELDPDWRAVGEGLSPNNASLRAFDRVGKAALKLRPLMSGKYFDAICFEPTVLSGLNTPGKCYTVSNHDITNFAKARVTLRAAGSTAFADIDTNADGVPEWSFSYEFGAALGTGAGLLGNTSAVTQDNLKTSLSN